MNKRGEDTTSLSKLLNMIIIIVSFGLILVFIVQCVNKGDDYSKEQLCRGAVATYANLDVPSEFTNYPCYTSQKSVPFSDDSRESLMKDVGSLAARCWWQWGEGYIEQKSFVKLFPSQSHMCRVCYTFDVNRESGLANDEFVSGDELASFLFTAPYKRSLLYGGGLVLGSGVTAGFETEVLNKEKIMTLSKERLYESRVELRNGVADFSNIIDDTTRAEIESVVYKFANSKTAEIAVIVVDELNNEDFNDKTFYELMNRWSIGSQDINNGLIIFVDLKNKKMRVEIGSGLEGVLYESTVSDMINNKFIENLDTNSFNSNLLSLVKAFETELSGEGVSARINQENTYMAYIYNDGRGILTTKKDFELKRGEQYAVSFYTIMDDATVNTWLRENFFDHIGINFVYPNIVHNKIMISTLNDATSAGCEVKK